ncbi:MAG: molecular chaperone HtpG [Candidatus Cloacimonetes bacterium]|nr:molecular chaperone HtpG [Candidatus Cloacimonadota bacterium]
MTKKTENGILSIHTENIFPIIKKWLYSEHDIFLRELVSNAVDAMQKRQAIQSDSGIEMKIEISIDKDKKSMQIIDYGIGMTRDEVKKYINQIAFSGAEDFIEKFKDKQSSIIGHFGLGFYSSYMVAKHVTIDTLSYKANAKPAFWECDGSTEYKMDEGKRTEPGTTVTVYFNEDSEQYIQETKIREILQKYCNFTPFPIELDKDISSEVKRLEEELKEEKITQEELEEKKKKLKVVNQQFALWNKRPSDVTDEEYKDFYRELFHDYEEPLFWLHLNVDYPFNLKGILYFPKLKNELDMHRGKVNLYCNNVFVAENLKDFIPEFLTLLKGGIDIPDIPLNVSRSFLQQDKTVNKITKYIIKKLADYLKKLFEEDRDKFAKLWDDIQVFIKYGILTSPEFFDAIKDVVVFKSSKGDWVTINEYKERNPQPKPEKKEGEDEPMPTPDTKIYYSAGENTHVTYLEMIKEQGIEVIHTTAPLDVHVFQHLEMRLPGVSFARIDSELNNLLEDKEKAEIVDKDDKTEGDKIKEIFEAGLDNKSVTIEPKRLKSDAVPAMIIFNEHMRRFQEMNMMMKDSGMDMLANHTLVVNLENKAVKKLLQLQGLGKTEDIGSICLFIHQLALLEQKKFSGEELRQFTANASKILTLI